MIRSRTYLDHNATSPLKPASREAMLAAFALGAGNASSVHAEGRAARSLIDRGRDTLAQALGVIAPMVILTSGGSESNNLALKGVDVSRLIVSATEHPSVMDAAQSRGLPVDTVPVDSNGVVDLTTLDVILGRGGPSLISIMLANNETGVIQPLREVAILARKHGAWVHTDAVQAFGKIPVNFGLLGVDMLSVSAHKLGGPVGAGALVVRDGLVLKPLIHGGGQELRRRAGTENVAAISGFAAAIEKPNDLNNLRDLLESQLEDAEIFSKAADRLPNTSCFAFPGISAETLLMNFDLDGIAVSSGSACSSGKVAKSAVLAAMGVRPELAQGAIRVSLGWNSTEQDVGRFIACLNRIKTRFAARAAA